MSQQKSAVDARCLLLMQATAAALAMPERLCPKRACRREHACLYEWRKSREPPCLDRLWPWQRALFDELFRIVATIHDNVHPPQPSKDPDRRALEAAAVEIVRASLPMMPEITHRFSDWCHRYRAPPQPPAPPIDTGRTIDEMKAQLERFRLIDETRAETDALIQRLAAQRGGRA